MPGPPCQKSCLRPPPCPDQVFREKPCRSICCTRCNIADVLRPARGSRRGLHGADGQDRSNAAARRAAAHSRTLRRSTGPTPAAATAQPAAADSDEPAGNVAKLQGSATVTRNGMTGPLALKDDIFKGDAFG